MKSAGILSLQKSLMIIGESGSECQGKTRFESRIFLLPTPAYSSNILGREKKKRVASHGMSLLPQPEILPQKSGR
jgi:hypothetical protein